MLKLEFKAQSRTFSSIYVLKTLFDAAVVMAQDNENSHYETFFPHLYNTFA